MDSVTSVPICHLSKGPAGGGGRENRQRESEKPLPRRGRRDRWAAGTAAGSEASTVIGKAARDPASQRETCSQPGAAGDRSPAGAS